MDGGEPVVQIESTHDVRRDALPQGGDVGDGKGKGVEFGEADDPRDLWKIDRSVLAVGGRRACTDIIWFLFRVVQDQVLHDTAVVRDHGSFGHACRPAGGE